MMPCGQQTHVATNAHRGNQGEARRRRKEHPVGIGYIPHAGSIIDVGNANKDAGRMQKL